MWVVCVSILLAVIKQTSPLRAVTLLLLGFRFSED